MQIVKAKEQSRNEIKSLLQSQNLPAEDLPNVLADFYTAVDAGELIGLIGMERYGHYGLLRSMVVHPDYRNKGIAETLVTQLEQDAEASGITEMYLLTETADKYFSKKGYATITRGIVPAELKGSSEFSHVCPVSAIVMKKHLAKQPETVS
ncbi:MAG TPA: arsenic resistance N-acetyltransferase ArsN2 [Flavisolibacter sp.]|nr:arsenic resistance N-acetyltransferase ArsN2 [Flavisolibacter sp.]